MKTLNADLLQKITEKVAEEISGDWIVIGGTVLPMLGIDYRVTVDVDIISFKIADNQSLLDLMRIAESLGLPVETINQAGGFFLNKIAGWQEKVILFHQGKKGRVYRPTLELFFQLKVARLSDSDLQDCIEYFKWSHQHGEDTKAAAKVIDRELKKENEHEREDRLRKLRKAIQ
jgi:hypothetical protein